MNKKKSILESNVLYTIIAIIAGFLIGAIFLMIAGISPAVAYGKLFSSIFSKPKYLVWTLVYASPLIFTGLSVAFSFRTGVFNIGAEGQFVIGGLVACVLGIGEIHDSNNQMADEVDDLCEYLNCCEEATPEVAICVKGGLVSSVYANANMDVDVYDLDVSDFPDEGEQEAADQKEAELDELVKSPGWRAVW